MLSSTRSSSSHSSVSSVIPTTTTSSSSSSSKLTDHSHQTTLDSSLLKTPTTDRTSLPISTPHSTSQYSSPNRNNQKLTPSQQCSQRSSLLFGTSSIEHSEHSRSNSPNMSTPHNNSNNNNNAPLLLQPSSSSSSSSSSIRKRLPSFNFTPDDESIEELLKTLGYTQEHTRATSSQKNSSKELNPNDQSRSSVVLLDIEGKEFSIHEHSLSPVSERTELDTESSKSSNNRRRPLVQSVLSQRFQSGIQSTAPLTLSPKPKPHSIPSSSPSSPPASLRASKQIHYNPDDLKQPIRPASFGAHSPNSLSPVFNRSNHQLTSPLGSGTNLGHPSLNRLPKKTSALIQLFESSTPPSIPTSTPPNKTAPPNRIQSSPHSNFSSRLLPQNFAPGKPPQPPVSPTQTREGSNFNNLTDYSVRRSNSPHIEAQRHLSGPVPQSPGAGSIGSLNLAMIPGPSITEQECQRLRKERRERIAMASKNHVPASAPQIKINTQPSHLEPPSPMSNQFLKHRKSVASSLTSRISDVQVLHSGSIWYRNPQTNQWRQTRGILTTEAIYLMNENGEVDQNIPDQSIELSLSGCTSVESVRSKRSYGPEFNEPHLHILRIAWAEFDPSTNSRTEYEEFLGCSRATQRADWVGAIWQAAHDLGGFVDQPDIPLRGNPSPKSAPVHHSTPPVPAVRQPDIPPSSLPPQGSSPRLDSVALVDRLLSVDTNPARPIDLVAPPAEPPLSSPSQLKPPTTSAVSSRASEASSGTSNLQSELDRDLAVVQQATTSPIHRLYSDETGSRVQEQFNEIIHADRGYAIDPNLQQTYIRPRSPELDIFAMLDRMSVKGSIHRNTAEFYDPPKPDSAPPQLQQAQDVHNPRPISTSAFPNIDHLQAHADTRPRSTSQHSYHTIRPTSVAGVHEHLPDSPRSSAVGSRSSRKEHLSEVMSTTQPIPNNNSQHRHLSANFTTNTTQQQPTLSSPQATPQPLPSEALHAPPHVRPARGAWSDTDRLSNQTDNILLASNPARAVQRDLRRILKTIERNDSFRAAESDSLGQYLDSIQHQLQNVATKLRGHPVEREADFPVNESDEPTIADKVDYMLSLCNILLESQHKVSSAVEKNLQAHGVSISNRSAHTRSMRSTKNPSRRSSRFPSESGMPGPAPLTPQPEGSLDTDQLPLPDRLESPPLPPLPDAANAGEEPMPNDLEGGPESPPEGLPQVAIQEAGLSRIENLLVALLSRVDESAQRQQQDAAAPVMPDKGVGDSHSAGSRRSRRSCVDTETQSGTLDLDADVALWKSRAKGRSTSDVPGAPWNLNQQHRFAQSVSSHTPSIYPPTEAETHSSSDQAPQVIPDYNLAYEAEDQVARRIADERARAARRLEGVSTPYGHGHGHGHGQFMGQGYPMPAPHHRVPSHLSQAPPSIAPNQDQQPEDPYAQSVHTDAPLSRADLEQSHWSSTTPTAEEPDDSAPPPPPPPKDEPFVAPPSSQAALSVRAPSRVPSRAVSHQSATRSVSIAPDPAPIVNPPQISPEELRSVVHEALQNHSTEQAPILEEVVTLLRNQDQVNQASVLNQGEVSRYLTQLNTHLDGVLHKKNDEILQIGENVGRLEKQLAVLLEQSQQISSVIPLMNSIASTSAAPPPEHAPTSIDRPEEAHSRAPPEPELPAEPQMDADGGPDVPVDVSVHPQEDDALDPPAEGGEPHVTLLSNKPSVGYRITGPRARKISFNNNKGLKGPRMPSGLATVGKLWGGPVPAADRASRWGTSAAGSLKRVPTKSSYVSENPADVEAALSAVNPDDPVGQEVLSQMDAAADDDRTGTIALGISHILKFLRENSEKEELRRQKKEEEKAAKPQPAIPDEMEQRRAKIEELQLRREATLAEDKAKQMDAMMQAMRQQAAEHDRLLKKISEELEAKNAHEPEREEEERKKRYDDAMADVNNVLTTVESGVMAHLEDFKAQMFNEMKQTFEKVGELRDQKQQIQADIADMLSFMSKVRGGGPDPRWQHGNSMLPGGNAGPEGSVAGSHHTHLAPIPESYPRPNADAPDREGSEFAHAGPARSVAGFGPRSPSRR